VYKFDRNEGETHGTLSASGRRRRDRRHLALMSCGERTKVTQISQNMGYIVLANLVDFQRKFAITPYLD
jgi:hypothetical protein